MRKIVNLLLLILIAGPIAGPLSLHAAVITFTQQYVYDEGTYYRARAVEAADIDEDGDMDVIVGDSYYDDLLWYDNNGSEVFTKRTIDSTYTRAAQIEVIDLDEDGDLDIVGGDNTAYAVFWWENDGSENFTEQTISSYGSDFAIVDLDDDGDYDVVTPDWSNGIRWAKNDGSENFTDQVIDASLTLAWTACAGDLTGDGNDDIVFNRYNSNLHLLTNDGSENFSSSILDTGSNAKTIACVDLDGDSDLDIITPQSVSGNIIWFDNNGSGVFTEKTVSAESLGTEDMQVIDFDADGDLDIVTADDGSNQMYWFENDGSESFTKNTVDTYYNGVTTVSVADIDGDSDLDVVGGSYENGQDVMWFESAGDSTPPSVNTLSPADDATGIATTANLVITFDEAVDAEAGASNDIVIKKTSDDSTIETIDAQDGKVTGSGTTTITINPAATLDEQIGYYVQIGTDAFDDAAGNSYVGITDTTSWSFTVGDFTNPTMSTLSPVDNATNINTSTNLVITFDEAVDAEAGASNDIVIKKTSDDSTIETIDAQDGKVTGSGTTTITINPAATLDDNIEYYVQVGTDSFDDTAGNSYAGITDTTSWSFTTGDYTSPTVSTLSPADDATSIQNISDLVITFDENVDIESGNVTIKRSTNDATVETIDVTGGQVTGTGTDTITIDPSSVLNALTEYYVQIDATAFDDANSNSFAGILDTTSWSFTTKSGGSSSVTSAPSPSLGGVDSEDGSGSSSGSSNATVTGVTGSTTVEAGDDVKVQWSSNSSVRLVNIYVSYDGGLTYEFVEGPIINTDNYSWDLPYDIDADSVKFKIEGTDLAEVIASIETDEIAIDVQDDCDCDIDEGTEQDDQEGQNDGVGDSIAEDSGSGLLELIDDAIEELLDGLIDEIEGVAQEVLEIIVPSFERDLTFGVTGEDVKELQQFLNSNGYNIAQDGAGSAGNETEYFGELTRQALVSWQQDNGLPAFGYFGPLTRELISSQGIVIEDIIDVDEIQEGEDVEVVFDRDLTLGSKGEDVRELQKYLNKSGYILADSGPGSRGNETDYFGELTRQALIKFQKAVGIKPAAGYFGPITRSFIK